MNKDELRQKLEVWDGKDTQYLVGVFVVLLSSKTLFSDLLELITEKEVEVAASWLTKYAIEEGAQFSSQQPSQLYQLADELHHWQSKLHILQLMPKVRVPADLTHVLMRFCQDATEDDNKFVRAWAYNGLFEIADQYAEFRDGLETVFQAALETEPPSVKSRMKAVQKKIAKNW